MQVSQILSSLVKELCIFRINLHPISNKTPYTSFPINSERSADKLRPMSVPHSRLCGGEGEYIVTSWNLKLLTLQYKEIQAFISETFYKIKGGYHYPFLIIH